jgi:hypothetical protein
MAQPKKKKRGYYNRGYKVSAALTTISATSWVVNKHIHRVLDNDHDELVNENPHLVDRSWISIGYTKKKRE